jgi:Na+/phosphate symporter
LFDAFTEMLVDFRDVLLTRNRALLERIVTQAERAGELSVEFALTHEDRLLEGLCSPFASSLFLDILDSIKQAAIHLRQMSEALLKITVTHESTS